MRAILADTGPLYALVDRGDRHHETAHRQLSFLTRDDRAPLVAQPILMESYSLLSRKLGLGTAQGWLSEISQGVAWINPLSSDYEEARRLIFHFSDQKISLYDACLAVLSVRLQTPIWTFDHHFDVLGSDVWRLGSAG